MFNKLQASRKLYLLIVVMSTFIIGIGLYGIVELKKMHHNTQTLYEDRVFPLQQLTRSRYNYSFGILNTAQRVRAHDISYAEGLKIIEEAERSIDTNWKHYILTYLTPKEGRLTKQSEALLPHSVAAIQKLKTVLKNDDAIATDAFMRGELYPAVNPVIENINLLISLQVQVSGEIYTNSQNAYNEALLKFLVIISLSLIFAVSFSYFLIRNVRELINSLRESTEKYQSLLEHAGDAVFLLNIDSSFNEVNSSMCKLTGYSSEEFLSMKLADLFSPEELKTNPLQIKNLDKDKELLIQRKWQRKDGTQVSVEINSRVLEGKGYLTIARDITKRILADEALRESEKKYRNIFENVQDVFYQTDLNGTILDVSPSVMQHLGYTREELIGTEVKKIYYNPEDRAKAIELLHQKGAFNDYELSFRSSSGQEVLTSLNVRLISNEDGLPNHLDGSFRNITEQKLAEKERSNMVSDIIQRNKDLEQFAYIISHNVRAPVANVIGITDLMNISDLNPHEKEEMMQAISLNVNKLDHVIKDLNSILQVKREMSEKKEPVKFSQLLKDVEVSILNLITNENVSIESDFSAIDEIFTLKSYLYSIFFNLISNSIKYKKHGSNAKIEVYSLLSGENVVLIFKDDGLGIDLSKYHDQVFGLYKRFHPETEGKGIGLFMVKTQVEILGGKISVNSQPNKGTEFRIEFELAN
jgi:PAS domain S-box-containing protein